VTIVGETVQINQDHVLISMIFESVSNLTLLVYKTLLSVERLGLIVKSRLAVNSAALFLMILAID